MSVLKQFEGNMMIEFVNGMRRYKGGYLNTIESDYARHGMGEEYGRDGCIVYEGEYDNGKRPSDMKLYCMNNCECLYNAFNKCWLWLGSLSKFEAFYFVLSIFWLISTLVVVIVIAFDSISVALGIGGFELFSALFLPAIVVYCKCDCCNLSDDEVYIFMVVLMAFYLPVNTYVAYSLLSVNE